MSQDNDASILEFLKLGLWFGGLPEQLQTLIIRESVVRSYRKGQVIVREGEPPKGLFVVLEGRVRAVRDVGDGEEILLHVGEAGCWFAYYSTLHRARSIGGVIADSRVRVLLLPAPKFERIVEDEPRYFREFANLALEHYAFLFKYVAEARGLRPGNLLRSRLMDLADLQRRDHPMEGPVSVNVSQADLATMVGVSRQTLSALLAQLQARGLIEVRFRSIRIVDEVGLCKECERDQHGDSTCRPAIPAAAASSLDA